MVMVGNGMCRMFLETDGKVYLYCPHSSKEFVRFGREYKEGEMFSFGGDSDEQG
jgi:ribosomal protein L24E